MRKLCAIIPKDHSLMLLSARVREDDVDTIVQVKFFGFLSNPFKIIRFSLRGD